MQTLKVGAITKPTVRALASLERSVKCQHRAAAGERSEFVEVIPRPLEDGRMGLAFYYCCGAHRILPDTAANGPLCVVKRKGPS